MHKATSLGILLLLGILAAVAWLLLDPAAFGSPGAEPGDNPDSTAARAIAQRSDAATAEAPSSAGERNARVALEPGPAPSAAPSGLALVGRVVDDSGAPLAKATVACSPGMGFDSGAFEPSDLELDDPAKMLERARALAQQRVEVVTDADGRFRIAPPGKTRAVELRVRARGHVALSQRADRPTKTDVDVGALALKRGAIVSGRVLDGGGQAVVSASVARRPKNDTRGFGDYLDFPGAELLAGLRGGGDDAVTDADGRFELAHVEPGEFSLRARHPDHPAARLDGLTVAAGKTLADLIVVVEPGATIRGRVVAIPEGTKNVRVQAAARRAETADQQQPGIMALLGDTGELMTDYGLDTAERSVVADPDGSFTLRGLGAGRTYRVWATQSGRGFAGNAVCSPRVEVASGAEGLELRYDAGVTVTFRVVDAQSGTPIERLWVNERLKGGGGFSDMFGFGPRGGGRSKDYPDGQVIIANLRPKKKQTLSVGVEARGFAKLERDGIALPAVGALDLGTLRLEPAPVVHVEVTAAADGKPVAGATVRLREQRDGNRGSNGPNVEITMAGGIPGGRGDARTARTDADGRCEVNGMPGAKVVISVHSREHAPYESETLTLPAREAVRHPVLLLRGGTVAVTVVDGKGAPVADITVEHTVPGGSPGNDNRKTDASGKLVFERLVSGVHRFRLGGRSGPGTDYAMALRMGGDQGGQAQPGWESVEVVDGAVATLELKKNLGTSLAGIVRENGVPLAGARIAWLEGPGEAPTEAAVQQFAAAIGNFGGDGSRNTKADDAGRYRLTELSPGDHRLRITHRERAMPTVVRVALQSGENAFDIELDLTVLRGTVRDPDGKPVVGATVNAAPAPADTAAVTATFGIALEGIMPGLDFGNGNRTTAKTGADGRFELRGVQSGVRLIVRAQAKGFAPASSAPVEVARGSAADTGDIKLPAAGRVRVQATVEGLFASAQATYAGSDAQGVAPVFQMLRNGVATLDGLRPGRWKIVVSAMGKEQGEPRFTDVVAGQTVEVSF